MLFTVWLGRHEWEVDETWRQLQGVMGSSESDRQARQQHDVKSQVSVTIGV